MTSWNDPPTERQQRRAALQRAQRIDRRRAVLIELGFGLGCCMVAISALLCFAYLLGSLLH